MLVRLGEQRDIATYMSGEIRSMKQALCFGADDAILYASSDSTWPEFSKTRKFISGRTQGIGGQMLQHRSATWK